MPRVQAADTVVRNLKRLDRQAVQTLQAQHNVNLHAAEDECDAYLDEDEPNPMISVIDSEEFFDRYFD
jgi:hypothetical protein